MDRVDDAVILAAVDDPAMGRRIEAAFAEAAGALGLPGAQAVLERLEDAARELAFVEALRARLLHRSGALSERLEGLAHGLRVDATRLEVLTRVRRLTGTAVARLQDRFAELDARTGEVMAFLRDPNDRRDFIRAQRDWLYGSLREWEPILAEWDGPGRTGAKGLGSCSGALTASWRPATCRCRNGGGRRRRRTSAAGHRGKWCGESRRSRPPAAGASASMSLAIERGAGLYAPPVGQIRGAMNPPARPLGRMRPRCRAGGRNAARGYTGPRRC